MTGARLVAGLLAAAAVAAGAVGAAGCGGDDPPERRTSTGIQGAEAPGRSALGAFADGVTAEQLGRGETSAWVIRPQRGPARRVVVFLHGWTAFTPAFYRPWLAHLAREGAVVVYPQYQAPPFLSPDTAFGAAVAGVRRALPVLPRGVPWIVAGHSAGGALAADLAGAAELLELPIPEAVLAAYPGRRARGIPVGLPRPALERLDDVRILALAGERDDVVGTREARRIARDTGGTFRLVTDDRVDDHLAPQRDASASRQVFWGALDALASGSDPSQVPVDP